MHILCTICSDVVNSAENIYVTKCGHVFHYHCLSQWIARSRTCPQCRNKVTEKCMFRLYPTVSNEHGGDDAATLQSRLDDAHLQLRQHGTVVKERDEKIEAITSDLKRQEDLLKSYEKRLVSFDSKVLALREQLDYANIQAKETQRYKTENEELKKTMQTLNDLQRVLNATSSEVEQMLQGYSDARTIATFATALKRALCESEMKKRNARDRFEKLSQKLAQEKKTVAELQTKVTQLEDDLQLANTKYEALQQERERQKEKELLECERDESMTSHSPRGNVATSMNDAMVLNSADSSLDSMVNSIENSDSPYLPLKQSSLFALMAQQRKPIVKTQDSLDIKTVLSKRLGTEKHSIFHKKQPLRIDSFDTENSPLDISYDGLGGHSKLDTFPVARASPTKSKVPKLSAKHKLKRPNPTGCQNIEQMLFKKRKSDVDAMTRRVVLAQAIIYLLILLHF